MSRLSLKQIKKSFGNQLVIPNLSLEIPDGAFVALLGPSGCGKTTLLRMVAGLESPSSGEISMGETVVFGAGEDLPPEERGLGMVFQSYAVWPHKSVIENVSYPLKLKRPKLPAAEIEKKSRDALSLVKMEALAQRMPHQLSGGQQQRVALARGLATQPPVLLLDEPLSNLDAKLRAEMRREIRELHRQSKLTILYVTHDQREAFEMATLVVVMNEGRIAQMGTPDQVRARPAAGFVAEFLGAESD